MRTLDVILTTFTLPFTSTSPGTVHGPSGRRASFAYPANSIMQRPQFWPGALIADDQHDPARALKDTQSPKGNFIVPPLTARIAERRCRPARTGQTVAHRVDCSSSLRRAALILGCAREYQDFCREQSREGEECDSSISVVPRSVDRRRRFNVTQTQM
jgi:hypothetical protein